ncbi:helix-loop-helix DNA-binding domain-containing protein [Paraphaeosphaeria sporulosa]
MLYESILTVPQADALFTPPSSYSPQKTLSRLDFRPDPFSDDTLDPDIFNMAGSGSPTPYIKEEHDDFTHNNFISQSGFSMNSFGNQQFSAPHESGNGINPSDLTMSGSMNMNNHFGGSNGYIAGGAGIADDELADSLGNFEQHQGFDAFGQNERSHQQDFFQPSGSHVIGSHQNINHQLYSNTPDDAPIQSPFVNPNGFDFNQYHNRHPMGFSGSMQGSQARPRISMSRLPSDNRSPMSPKTPAISNLHLGTPDSGNFGSQPIMASRIHGHKPSMSSTQWDGTPGSGHSNSWVDSPSSPHGGNLQHHQISEVMHSAKHASLPAKVDIGQTQDAKKRRRRESHNLVERRRRDNINERIHDLSRLVPQHRLEDEKIRKHINNNGPLSPTLGASGMSPPQATSLLAGGAGRRAAGNITQGLPLEEKDKGPNKGDILNGAVSWTRDLMWLLYKMTQERDEMQARLQQLSPGENWEPDQTEEVRRMRTELVDAVEKNGFSTFKYSRGPGSGLRVPKHTNLAGEPLNHTPQSLSPDMQSNGSGSNINANNTSHQYWTNQSLKEEDENFMELN